MVSEWCPHCGSRMKPRPSKSIQAFLAARVDRTGDARDTVQATPLYEAYVEFCKTDGLGAVTVAAFGRALPALNVGKTMRLGCVHYRGIQLKTVAPQLSPTVFTVKTVEDSLAGVFGELSHV